MRDRNGAADAGLRVDVYLCGNRDGRRGIPASGGGKDRQAQALEPTSRLFKGVPEIHQNPEREEING
jgi:hypothetical protein